MFECRCPVCGASARLADENVGRKLRCKKCDERFVATRPLYIAPFEPEIIERVVRREKTPEELNAETMDNLISAVSKFGDDYINQMKLTLLANVAVIFLVLFFCCGLPMIMSAFQPQR